MSLLFQFKHHYLFLIAAVVVKFVDFVVSVDPDVNAVVPDTGIVER